MKRPLSLVLVLWSATAMLTPCVQGAEYRIGSTPLFREGTLSGDERDFYRFSLKEGDRANWTVQIENRTRMDILLLTDAQFRQALAGPDFSYIPVGSARNTSLGGSRQYDHPGGYAILVRPASNATQNASYDISIRIRLAPAKAPAGITAGTVFNAILAALIIGGAGGVIHLFHLLHVIRGRKHGPSHARSVACPSCGSQAVFHPEAGRYFCPSESKWL